MLQNCLVCIKVLLSLLKVSHWRMECVTFLIIYTLNKISSRNCNPLTRIYIVFYLPWAGKLLQKCVFWHEKLNSASYMAVQFFCIAFLTTITCLGFTIVFKFALSWPDHKCLPAFLIEPHVFGGFSVIKTVLVQNLPKQQGSQRYLMKILMMIWSVIVTVGAKIMLLGC